ncbi:MAG: dTMP kinase [Candidatus Babeliales bacterium]|nr:dTMP kinase [Candidatus Babeliales bacterium]
MKKLEYGFFIAIEGIDGSGKSTLAKNIYNYLNELGYETILTKEPGGTPLGLQLRTILQTKNTPVNTKAEFLLFAADRAQHFSNVIMPALNNNKIIISDRLNDSSIAYQGYGRSLDIETLKHINNWAMGDIKPNLTIFVRVDTNIAFKRIKARKEELTDFEKEQSFMNKVAFGFQEMYQNRTDVVTLDGNKTQEELLADAVNTIKKHLQ